MAKRQQKAAKTGGLIKTAVARLRKGLRRIPSSKSFHILPVGKADVLKTKATRKATATKKRVTRRPAAKTARRAKR